MSKKYIGAAIISSLAVVAGYMLFSDEQNKQLFAPVSEEIQPTKKSIFTTEKETVSEFGENPYRASERFKNSIIRIDGVIGYIHSDGDRILLARGNVRQTYEVAVFANTGIVKNFSVGDFVMVYGEFGGVFKEKLIVIYANKITAVK